MKRLLIGIALACIFFVMGFFFVAAGAGFMAGMRDPEHAEEAGAKAGEEAVEKYASYVAITAVAFGVLGAWIGVKPAARESNEPMRITDFD